MTTWSAATLPRDQGDPLAVRAAVLPTVAVVFLPVALLAAAQGGYFPTSWGWAAVPLLWTAAIALVVRSDLGLSRHELAFILGLAGVLTWTALSTAWSAAPAKSVLEVERTLVYVAGATTVLVLARSRFTRHLLGAVLSAIAVIGSFSLATRLFPDRIGIHDRMSKYRLSEPIGYWNGLAVFAAVGILLALGFVARARRVAVRAACSALLVVLLPTFYFTFGRAAWIALAAGLAFAIAFDRRRLQLLAAIAVVAPAPVVATWIAARDPALTHAGTSVSRAAHAGHRFAVALLALAAANAAAGAAFAQLERRVVVAERIRTAFAAVVVLALVAGAAVTFVRFGNPAELASKGYRAFKAPPPHVENLNRRLLSFSGNGRADMWRLAWDDMRRHPLLGSGAGTYERYFLAHQPNHVSRVRDAHGLYVETLAELGVVGLVFLSIAFLAPFAALGRARSHPLAAIAAGGYAAYLVHAAADWDWELPAVTLVGLACGASILVAARRAARPVALSMPVRAAAVVALLAMATFSTIGLVGNTALSRAGTARAHHDWTGAAVAARRAHRWLPWSPAPWAALGEAQLGAGLPEAARRSFRKALGIDGGDWELWYDLASASRGSARRRALAHAVSLFPRSGLLQRSQEAVRGP